MNATTLSAAQLIAQRIVARKHFLFAVASALLLATSLFAHQADKIAPPVPPSGNVTLTLEEYNRLVELAAKEPKRVEPAPIPYVLQRADLKLHAANDTVLGSIQLQGETFSKGETKVALTSGPIILDARQEGKPLPLVLENGTQTAVLPGPANFSVNLEAGLPLSTESARASFSLMVPAAGSAQLTLEVPGDRTSVHLSPGLITSHESQNGKTVIEATLVPGQTANIWWTTREVVAPVVPREVRFLSNMKTLVSISEADIRLAVLADITVLQGQPTQLEMLIPAGYEVSSASGPTLDSTDTDTQNGILILKLNAPAQKSQQFLIALEKASTSAKADVPFVSLKNSQRETGEVLVEGVGAMELTATEGGSLKRMDFKETNATLRSLSRATMQAAFRYHRQPNENPSLALEWTRFPDSSVLAAVAENATVTTLVTNEGRSLTEVRLTVKNQAQPFLKVELPAGATIVSAEVAGEKVKPVEGSDGHRVPLLRPGFRPVGSYEVSYVFMHSGTPFAKKGGSEISLPKMDVPITVLQWEVFLPEQYKVKDFGGDAISANLLPVTTSAASGDYAVGTAGLVSGLGSNGAIAPMNLTQGQIGGYIVDSSGAATPNTKVTVKNLETGYQRFTTTDDAGRWSLFGMTSGRLNITAAHPGFKTTQVQSLNYDANNPSPFNARLEVASASETVEVTGSADVLQSSRDIEKDLKKQIPAEANVPSSNVLNLQQRVSGVLPVRVDVPRAGTSFRFVRPLVLDEETKLTFTYKTK
jgi:Carboxypeptidase regulatory-like domain